MPMIYGDENPLRRQNGAKLDIRDIADDCGSADGERYAFLEAGDGLVFARDAYTSTAHAAALDEAEDYIETMLGGLAP